MSPLDGILRLTEATRVAEDAGGNIFNAAGMVQGDVDAEPVVAPVHVAADRVLRRQMLTQRRRQWRWPAARANVDARLI